MCFVMLPDAAGCWLPEDFLGRSVSHLFLSLKIQVSLRVTGLFLSRMLRNAGENVGSSQLAQPQVEELLAQYSELLRFSQVGAAGVDQ
jgi:hypothetical protein